MTLVNRLRNENRKLVLSGETGPGAAASVAKEARQQSKLATLRARGLRVARLGDQVPRPVTQQDGQRLPKVLASGMRPTSIWAGWLTGRLRSVSTGNTERLTGTGVSAVSAGLT